MRAPSVQAATRWRNGATPALPLARQKCLPSIIIDRADEVDYTLRTDQPDSQTLARTRQLLPVGMPMQCHTRPGWMDWRPT